MPGMLEEIPSTMATSEWPRALGAALSTSGPWAVFQWLLQRRQESPQDLRIRGYVEILRNVIVREFLKSAGGMDAVPKLTPEFLSDYGRFNLSAQEGYLVSLIDGRISMQQILKVSPFDNFATMFCFARLQHLRAVTV